MKTNNLTQSTKIFIGLIIILLLIIGAGYFYFEKKLQTQDAVIATIDGKDIYQSELTNELIKLYGKETLDEMINRKVINIAAEKYDVKADQKDIEQQYNDFKKDYGSEEDFLQYLNEQMGWTKEELYDYIEYYTLWEEIATKDVTISDEELLAYYNDNKDRYSDPQKFHIEQIIVETKEEADQVLSELKNGSDFNTLAKERSIDVFSLGNGGDLGIVTEDDESIDARIFEKAKVMEIDSIAIVPLDDAYAIIRLQDRSEKVQYSYEEVKGKIRRELALNHVGSLPEVLEQLKAELNVQVTDPTLIK